MATVTSILSTDIVSDSRSTINTNFDNLNKQTQIVYKSTTQTTTTSVLTADTELSFLIGANEAWKMEMNLIGHADATSDLKYTFLVPAGANGYFTNDDALGQVPKMPSVMSTVSTTGSVFGGINGIFINGSVAGTVGFYWAQNTSTPSSVISINQGSNIIAFKLN